MKSILAIFLLLLLTGCQLDRGTTDVARDDSSVFLPPGRSFSIGGVPLGIELEEISQSCSENPDFRLVKGQSSYQLTDDRNGGSLTIQVDRTSKINYIRGNSRVSLHCPNGLEIRTRDPIEKINQTGLSFKADGPKHVAQIPEGFLEIEGIDDVSLYRLAKDRADF